MRLRYVIIAVLLTGITTFSFATLYPVTGDSTTVWNEIDLLPAENRNPEIAEFAPGEPATDDSAPAPSEQQTAPAAPPSEHTGIKTASPTTAAARQPVAAPPAEPPAVENTQQQPANPPAAEPDVSTTAAVAQEPVTDSATAAAVAPPIQPGTIIITSIPDTVAITINDVSVGITPYNATGFYPGLYEVVLYREGYEQYRKTIDLKENGTEFITASLERERGMLFVSTVPESAQVLLNDSLIGVTPVASRPLLPGMYQLRIEAQGYTPYTEQLTVSPKLTDTLQVSLLPLEKPKFAGFPGLRKTRTLRRISFGAVGALCIGAGYACNEFTKKKLDHEKEKLTGYQEAQLSESEYDQRYSDYISATKVTDRFAAGRNVLYTIGIICGIGFAVSLPF